MKSIAINNKEFYALVKEGYTVVDVRTQGEDTITGLYFNSAINIPYPKVINSASKTFPDKNSKLIFICNYGQRSSLTAKEYQKMGYSNVFVLSSGLYNLK
ncbi:sulfurtransferase [Entomoplasma ellychniae]|uniref:Sulfurtransferase n=2 Tax=Entomoplasmataceae TaxID=33925 RepID=A0A2S5RH12_9MOLU|nr:MULTISPECIES: rhodanese-like domain-containing protein [Entomoplasmataceae]PPE04880.1 sulfurtransferase [Entomoplasma ellychniae]PPE06581.1 sulfurtransferase [Mesoplasma corruscae]